MFCLKQIDSCGHSSRYQSGEHSLDTSKTNNDSRLNAVHRYRRSTLLAFVVLAMSLASTGWAWRSNRLQARERARTRLQQEIDRTRTSIRTRLEVYEDALYGTRSLFEANRVVTRSMFRDYVTNLKLGGRYPGIQGIGYALRIPPSQVSSHIQCVHREGFPQYRIRPEGRRAEYTSIVYLEPFDWRNQRAFGYDMFSEPVRRAGMEHARDSGMASLTGKVKLVQETDKDVQAGFLMYLPLYRRDVPLRTVEERRAALLGYIYSPFRLRDFMKELVHEDAPLARFEVFSGHTASPDSLMYRDPDLDGADKNYTPTFTSLSQIDFGGQTWTVRFSTSPNFDAIVREGENRSILPAGVIISLLLFGIIISVAQTERRAVRLADIITEKLSESEERVRAITETATDAILSANSRGLIVYFNPAAERIFEYAAADVVGKPLTLLMPERFHDAHARAFESFLRTRHGRFVGRTVEMIGRRSDGTEFPVSISLSTWQAGEVFVTGILRDITDRKLAEAKIVKLNQELTDALFRSEKLAITGRLVATIAHEINNPLEALMNLLFVLESEDLSPKGKQFLQMAQDQVALLTNISRQTLSPYREAKFPAVTNISELLDDVLSMLRPKLLATNVQVERHYPASVEVTIYASELRQVFTNLIANAIDAMTGGGLITLTVSSVDGRIEISVADTGPGIAPEHRNKLFEPFFTTKAENGTGVGLWVVKQIVGRIGGTVEFVTSTAPNKHGTTFTISFPTTGHATEQQGQQHAAGSCK